MSGSRLIIPVVAVALLGALFAFGLLRGAPDRDIESAYLGEVAPGFTMPLYERYHPDYQEALTFSDYAGRPAVVNFWASWCIPCYQEAPVLQEYWERYQGTDLLMVGVHTQNRDGYGDGRDFISQFGLTFPNGFDKSSDISIDWGLYGVPETFFVNRDGRVVHKHVGPVTAQVMDEQLGALLN